MTSEELSTSSLGECIRLINQGKPAAAKISLTALQRLFPDDHAILHALGVSQSLTDDKVLAVETFRRALERNAANVEVALHLASDLIHLRRLDEADRILRQVLSTQPDNPVANFFLASASFEMQQYATSLELFDKVVRVRPAWPEAWYRRGNALLALGQADAALASFQCALDLAPGMAEANERLGETIGISPLAAVSRLVIRGGLGDFLQSVAYLQNAGRLKPRLIVISHFEGAESFFDRLGIDVSEYAYFSTTGEFDAAHRRLVAIGRVYSCPRRRYFDRSPFRCQELSFAIPRPVLGVHLGASSRSRTLQSIMGPVRKDLPIEILHRLVLDDRFNIILFGSAAEIESFGVKETDCLKFACFPDVTASLAVVAQCQAVVASDSVVKTMASMLRIPSIVWLSDHVDRFRDQVFIDPYVTDNIMKVFRFRHPLTSIDEGMRFTRAALAGYSVLRD